MVSAELLSNIELLKKMFPTLLDTKNANKFKNV